MAVRAQTDSRAYFGRGDCLVVAAGAIKRVLDEWIKKHEEDHPKAQGESLSRRKGRAGKKLEAYPPGFSGVQYLAFHSGYGPRTVTRILNLEVPYVTLSVTEALLMAIDREYLLSDGSLRVMRDPRVGKKIPRRGQLTEAG